MRKIYPRSIHYLRFINCLHFFEVWRHSFDGVRFIFKRRLFSGECKSWAHTLFSNENSITISTFLSNPELIRACHGLEDFSQRLAEMLASLKIQEAVF